jgi:hypothetical protein
MRQKTDGPFGGVGAVGPVRIRSDDVDIGLL